MTPKEKAIELYNKMYETGFKPKSVLIRIEQAKECALIAVEEILKAVDNEDETYLMRHSVNYWSQVKQELENL